MSKRDIGAEILAGLTEIKEHKAEKRKLIQRELKDPSPALEIRRKLKLSQSEFAALMGVSIRTIQDWEQGRRRPRGPAKSLLRVVESHPGIFRESTF